MDDLAATSPRVVAAIVELVYGDLARDPRRVGKPLRFEFEGLYSARRAEYRVIYGPTRLSGESSFGSSVDLAVTAR